MQTTQPAYFTACRSVRMTRDAQGVLVVGYGLSLEGASAADLVKSGR